jgi:glyoxylase-like metal-dependent hydrolase (beta-lactamase superfamily II)
MKLTRKQFLKTSVILGSGLLFQGNRVIHSVLKDDPGFTNLGENIGIFKENGGTIAWYAADDAIIIIDAQFPKSAKHLVAGLKKKTNRKFDMLINTHHHHDHTDGNVVIKDFVQDIVANENCVKLQLKNNIDGGKKKVVAANKTFKDKWSAAIGKQKINAMHLYNAHTGGDSVIHFENQNIVHVGDLVFNGIYPWIGGAMDESGLIGWVKYLEAIADRYPSNTTYVCGHGKDNVVLKKADLYVMRDYISALHDFVKSERKKGKNREQIASSTSIPGVKNRVEAWEGAMKANLEAAYEIIGYEK